MISVVEKEFAIKHSMNYFEGVEGMLLFKILANFVAKTTGFKDINIGDSVFSQINAEKLMRCIVSIAASGEMMTVAEIGATPDEEGKI